MKKIKQVIENQVFEYTGDLVIEGDVENNAQIRVLNGSLTILGSIKDSVVIQLHNDQKKPNINILSNVSIGNFSSFSSGNISIGGRSFTLSSGTTELQKLTVQGSIGDRSHITADDIEIGGAIGQHCVITSKMGQFIAKSIGPNSKIEARNAITVTEVGDEVSLSSNYGEVSTGQLANEVTIKARNKIEISGIIGNGCELTSEYDGVEAVDVGNKVKITARSQVQVQNIGVQCKITSQYEGVSAHKVDMKGSIKARNNIELRSIGEGSTLSSEYGEIDVANIGYGVTLKARNTISAKNVGNGSTLKSEYGSIEVANDLEDNVELEARNDIKAKNVGSGCTLSSAYGAIRVHTVGEKTKITARNDIAVKGYYAPDAKFNSNYGKVNKPKDPGPKPTPKVAPKAMLKVEETNYTQAYLAGMHDAELAHAMTLSQAVALGKQGVFAQPKPLAVAPPQQDEDNDIPGEYICPITLDIMKNPVLCMLDGFTYEDTAIRESLKRNNCSPMNRREMRPGQSIEDVLAINRNLKDSIEHFLASKNKEEVAVNPM